MRATVRVWGGEWVAGGGVEAKCSDLTETQGAEGSNFRR